MATTVGSIAGLISTSLQESESFQNYEKTLLQILNELGRQLLQCKFEETSRQYDSEYILVDGLRYKRFSKGTVEHHSLCGSIPVERYTYRQTGVRNGLTVVPLELEEQLVARTTRHLRTVLPLEMHNVLAANGKNSFVQVTGSRLPAAHLSASQEN